MPARPTDAGAGAGAPAVRPATPDDVPAIAQLVRALAAYERAPEEARATDADFHAALFPSAGTPTAHAHVATVGDRVVGMAVWFLTFSTWTGTNGIWLEDLYVDPARRGTGLGTALLRGLADLCVERGYQRLEWCVLDWNTPSIGFYESIGAVCLDQWQRFRLEGGPMRAFSSVPRTPGAEPS